uniref:Uncharacterized protein n=1 Tax=Anguilla anguilla TaxID=7936 RepID=A0A0E9WZP5_ANGAN
MTTFICTRNIEDLWNGVRKCISESDVHVEYTHYLAVCSQSLTCILTRCGNAGN